MTSPIIVKAPFTLADTSNIEEQAARFLADSLGTAQRTRPEFVAENDSDDEDQAA